MDYQLLPFGSSLNIHRLSGQAPSTCPAHCHDFYEVYFNLGEEMQYFIANQNYTIGKHDFAFIDCNVFHHTHYRPNSRIDRINLYFGRDLLNRFLSKESAAVFQPLFESRRVTLSRDSGQRMEKEMAQDVLPLFSRNIAAPVLRAQLKTVDLLLELAQMLQEGAAFTGSPEKGSHNSHISGIVDYIEEKYMEHLTLDDIAGHLYLNKYYVSHMFSKVTGLSISDYLLMRRIREAKQLLVYSNTSVTEIALAVGYSNSNHFSKCFKHETNYSPREYREKFSPREGLF